MTIRDPFPLPIKKTSEKKDLTIYEQKICAIIRAQRINGIIYPNTDFEEEVAAIAESIWQGAYSKGLSDMDKMHKTIDAMIEKAKKL